MKMTTIPALALALVSLALASRPCYADDPCEDAKMHVVKMSKTMDFGMADKLAPTGRFAVQRTPANKNSAVEQFQINYVVEDRVVWRAADAASEDSSLDIRAKGKHLFYDFLYGAGGGIQCHLAIALENGRTIIRCSGSAGYGSRARKSFSCGG